MQRFLKPDAILTKQVKKGKVYILFGDYAIFTYPEEDDLSNKNALVQLSQMGVSDRSLEKIFGTNRAQIKTYREVFAAEGIIGLANLKRGRPKTQADIRDYIEKLYERLDGRRGYQEIIMCEVDALFHKKITRRTLQRILKEIRDTSLLPQKTDSKKKRKNKASVAIGSLLLLPLIERSGILKLMEGTVNQVKEGYYSARDIILTLMVAFTMEGAVNEEQIKRLDAREMGVIIGKRRIPSVQTTRKIVAQMAAGVKYRDLAKGLARLWMRERKPEPVYYVDGHFMPYYGKEKTLKGFHAVRRLVTKGRTEYFIHDRDGYPLFFILSDGYETFRHYLKDISGITRDCHPEKREKITLVFDRGGYGKDVSKEIGKRVNYISWKLKGSRVPPGKVKWKEVLLDHAGNEWGKPKTVPVAVCEKRGNGIRDIWIQNGKKISPAVTSDMTTPLPEIVRRLLRRWGAQENGFKILKNKGIDSISSYRKLDWDLRWLKDEGLEKGNTALREVNNPVLAKLKKEKVQLKKWINKLEENAGRKALKKPGARGRKRKLLSTQTKKELRLLKFKMKRTKARIALLPEKVNLYDEIKKRKIVRLSSEKKGFLDIIRMLAVRFEKDLKNIVGPAYKNNRDVRDYCLRLLNLRGKIIEKDGKEQVIFNRMNTKRETQVLYELCQAINKITGQLKAGRSKRLFFSVNP